MSFGGGNDVQYAGPSVARTDGSMFDPMAARKGFLDRVGDVGAAAFGYKAKGGGPSTSLISSDAPASPAMMDTPGRHKSLLGQ